MEYINNKVYNLTIFVEAVNYKNNCLSGKERFFVDEISKKFLPIRGWPLATLLG